MTETAKLRQQMVCPRRQCWDVTSMTQSQRAAALCPDLHGVSGVGRGFQRDLGMFRWKLSRLPSPTAMFQAEGILQGVLICPSLRKRYTAIFTQTKAGRMLALRGLLKA